MTAWERQKKERKKECEKRKSLIKAKCANGSVNGRNRRLETTSRRGWGM